MASQKNITSSALPCRQHASPYGIRRSFFLSARTMTVDIHCAEGGRNCRETIASLRNSRATRYHVTNFLCWRGRRRLRGPRYYILARISECRDAEREGEDPDCTSNRPAAPATESASFSHAATLIPMEVLSKLNPDPPGIFAPAHFLHVLRECISPSRENVRVEYCSGALLLPRFGCLPPRRVCHRLQQRIPILNLPPIIAQH